MHTWPAARSLQLSFKLSAFVIAEAKDESTPKSAAPYFLIATAFICAVIYANTEAEALRRYTAGGFGAALGLALLLLGKTEYREGRIRGARTYVDRRASPVTFHLLLLGKRILPGSIMLIAGIWYTFVRKAA